MPYRAVIFDLFGTLVNSFTRREYDPVNARMAAAINAPYAEFWQLMGDTLHDSCLGRYSSFEHLISDICSRTGVHADKAQIAQAAAFHYEFVASAIVPEPEVLEALDKLKKRGYRLGLISDCGPPIPLFFPQSPLARLIDIPVFSCEEQIKKPSSAIYQRICQRIEIEPHECIYVGDGSSQELTGAAAVGMRPVLKRTDLSDVYDSHRPEVENWRGPAVDEIKELCEMPF
ncbi:MAG: HAD family hydrolase [Caldilineaceae bacterium SB0670_bin_27]|uniref:HAD family hydrolase n=1 Tax=Caldilineaceae bacterium SB0664_bin_27 TaxID=2605260 RepID=A0A6B0YX82_9CHLR|nr:HAD family hydrolase [Caldilineaceae bacterium SB0664_bin_27]MYJ77415.1 HAD family hydrolase [Caldilineaceae bacterium SB0670_bin_27]